MNREHVQELCDALIELESPLEWTCFSRTDLWDRETLERMYQAGCRSILFGVESGNEEVLARTKRGFNFRKRNSLFNGVVISALIRWHLSSSDFLLETPARIVETIQFAKQLNPTYAQFHQARAFFEHDDWQELGTVSGSWEETSASLNGLAYVPNGFTQRDIVRWLLSAYVRFYANPRKVGELMSTIREWSDMKRLGKGVQQISSHFVVL